MEDDGSSPRTDVYRKLEKLAVEEAGALEGCEDAARWRGVRMPDRERG
jgi:hypothetical protein